MREMCPKPETCTLDQWMTSAGAAMAFAALHWDHFVECMADKAFIPVPITKEQMWHHGAHVIDLADPSRMPPG